MPGPPRKPTDLLQNMSRKAEREREGVSLPPEIPKHPPTWLPREAKAEWRRVTAWMDKAGTVQSCNRGLLAQYCIAWSTLHEATAAIERDGHTLMTAQGRPMRNPWVSTQLTVMAHMRMAAAELGITPGSMSKVRPTKKRKVGRKLSPLLSFPSA